MKQNENIERHILMQIVLAKTDYLAGVPGAYQRFQYWTSERERLSVSKVIFRSPR